MKWIATVLAVVVLAGCTRIDLERKVYWSVLQQKTLQAEFNENGSIKSVHYNTSDSPAVQALAEIASRAQGVAEVAK